MGTLRIPWWIHVVAVACTATFLLGFVYFPIVLPAQPGYVMDRSGVTSIARVRPGSAAEGAGLKQGDLIISVNGQKVLNNEDEAVLEMHLEPGRPIVIGVSRDRQPMEFTLAPAGDRREFLVQPAAVILARGIFFLVSLLDLVIGLLILYKRPHDVMAVTAGIVLCLLAAQSDLYNWAGSAVIFRGLPTLVQWLTFPIIAISTPWPIAALFLSLTFPRPLFRSRWLWLALGVFAAAVFLDTGYGFYAATYRPELILGSPGAATLALLGIILSGIALVCALVVLFYNFFACREPNERRRVRLVLLGLIAWLVGLIVVATLTSIPELGLNGSPWATLVVSLSFIPFPICLAYAVLTQRLFEVSIVVRQGLQYAVARGALLVPVPLLAGALILDVVTQKNRPVGELLSAHGGAYAIAAVAAVVAHRKRKQWMEALDLRFYRERYNAQQLLRQTVEEVRSSSGLAEAAPKVAARIEQALHPTFVAVMCREAFEPVYGAIGSAPPGLYPRGLRAESKLMSAFRLFAKPLQISLAESGWLKQQLPTEDTNFLREASIDLMVPIALAQQGREALLVLGAKRSEEPYSEEDRELLSAIGGALAMLVKRPVAAGGSGGLEECPQCGLCYESGMGRCANEGARLTPTPIPRLLSSRYRLERRLGKGGMGTVYKATDTSLERAVAVKVIRDDLVASPEAAERFRREARATASLAHPNLVTVHDFGVDPSGRVFLVMELLDGVTLRQALQKEKRLTAGRAAQVLREACAGVELAHEQGLIHRDLKPENVFLARGPKGDTAKVLDFGLAKFLDVTPGSFQVTAETASGLLVGTPQYMSPEQLAGETPAPSWDVWALCVMTYEMLTGAHPFLGGSVAQVHHSIVSGKFPALSQSLPGAPGQWQEFFERTLTPQSPQRPRNVAGFLAMLETTFPQQSSSAFSSKS